jgi:hypothetical protein
LEAWFDGVKVISVTDTAFASGGVGLRNNLNTVSRYLDFKVYYASQAVMVEEGTTNLLTANQASVETDLAGLGAWSPNGDIVFIRDTSTAWIGLASAKVTNNWTGAQNCTFGTSGGTSGIPATAGYSYSVSAWMKASTTITAYLHFQFWDSSGVFLLDQTVMSVTLSNVWQRLSGAYAAPANTAYVSMYCHYDQLPSGASGWGDGLQIEQKAYPTSFQLPGTARAAETLTIPTANIFTKSNWTVELNFQTLNTVTSRVFNQILFDCYIDGGNRYVVFLSYTTGMLTAWVVSGGTTYAITDTIAILPNTAYKIMFSGDGANMRLCKNGAQVGTDLAYVEPIGILPINMKIGGRWDNNNGSQLNGFIDDFRISNRARTLTEHQAVYNSGLLLQEDSATTYLLSMNGHLVPRPYIPIRYFSAKDVLGNDILAINDYSAEAGKWGYSLATINEQGEKSEYSIPVEVTVSSPLIE